MQNDMQADGLAAGIDAVQLGAYLVREGILETSDVRLDRIGGGQSNPTFFVSGGGRSVVLRKQPAGVVLPTAHRIDREFRVLSALHADGQVPVPRTLVYCDDAAVAGTPFYVMERLEGRVPFILRLRCSASPSFLKALPHARFQATPPRTTRKAWGVCVPRLRAAQSSALMTPDCVPPEHLFKPARNT